MERKLKNGYTSGTCAAAAVTAAAWHAFGGQERHRVQVELPGGGQADMAVEKASSQEQGDQGQWFFVVKDGGDDPDVTHGARVYGLVEPLERREDDSLWYRSQEYPCLFLTGGPGIGVVTRPGLGCPVGAYAINPVPRAMIFRQVGRVYKSLEMKGDYLIRVKIPQGVELARKTFNPRLGIEGGISVLGTSGIVRPMSEQALKDTIRLEIHMRAAAGEDSLIMVPGNYGEHFLRESLGISSNQAVQCSNFVADALGMAAEENIKRVLFVGHIGKPGADGGARELRRGAAEGHGGCLEPAGYRKPETEASRVQYHGGSHGSPWGSRDQGSGDGGYCQPHPGADEPVGTGKNRYSGADIFLCLRYTWHEQILRAHD